MSEIPDEDLEPTMFLCAYYGAELMLRHANSVPVWSDEMAESYQHIAALHSRLRAEMVDQGLVNSVDAMVELLLGRDDGTADVN